MNLGYDRPLHLLPLDHRQSCVTEMFHFKAPLHALQDAGIEPDVLKVEGLASRADGERIMQTARRGGRDQVGCIVIGRGADEAKVRSWLTVAASVVGFIGFAVGRTSFWDVVSGYHAQTLTRDAAATQIARRLREWVGIFEAALSAPPARSAGAA